MKFENSLTCASNLLDLTIKTVWDRLNERQTDFEPKQARQNGATSDWRLLVIDGREMERQREVGL